MAWILPIGGVPSGRVYACSLHSRLVFLQSHENLQHLQMKRVFDPLEFIIDRREIARGWTIICHPNLLVWWFVVWCLSLFSALPVVFLFNLSIFGCERMFISWQKPSYDFFTELATLQCERLPCTVHTARVNWSIKNWTRFYENAPALFHIVQRCTIYIANFTLHCTTRLCVLENSFCASFSFVG